MYLMSWRRRPHECRYCDYRRGFAARQLVKNIRKTDTQVLLTVIAADSIDEYNKPDLSHVISLNQRADDLIRQSAQEFAQQYNVALFPHTGSAALMHNSILSAVISSNGTMTNWCWRRGNTGPSAGARQ